MIMKGKEIVLVSIVGESGGVVTEALEYVYKRYENIKSIKNVILYSKEPRVIEEVNVLKKILKLLIKRKRFNMKLRNVFKKMPIKDIEEERDIKRFKRFLNRIMFLEVGKKIIFNISGGRKSMIILTLEVLRNIGEVTLINIISYMSREEISELGDIIREKINANLTPEDEEIEKYFFSDGKYKVFELKL